jgi:hypothetical protein
MKKIEAFPIWYNGELKNATIFNVMISNLILGTCADITYELYSEVTDEEGNTKLEAMLVRNGISLFGQEYNDWGNDDDYIWTWSANKLGLVIVPQQENI